MTYRVKAIFDTIQGEGLRAGTRAIFVRFAGCNLWNGRPEDRAKGKGACARWCDTDFATGDPMTAEDIVARLDSLWPEDGVHARWCVLTGGEPTLQVDPELLMSLRADHWCTAMETNGTTPIEMSPDWLTLSPKKGGQLAISRADELKVVLPGAVDPEQGWTEDELLAFNRLDVGVRIVQPQDPTNSDMVEDSHLHPAKFTTAPGLRRSMQEQFAHNLHLCLTFVRSHPNWRLGSQQHKLWQLP